MPKNEDGEFELLVGNKQLLSIVFVMMVLFGVVFSLGYFVGRNSTPDTSGKTAEAAPARSGVPQPAAELPPQPPAPAPGSEAPLEPGEAKITPTTTTPVGGAPASEPLKPPIEPVAARPPEMPQPKPVEAPKVPDMPGPGQTFLQVAAVKRAEAELIVDVLKKKGFPALVAPVVANQPEDALWRALVGPLKDSAAVADMRSALQAAGFKEIFVRKY